MIFPLTFTAIMHALIMNHSIHNLIVLFIINLYMYSCICVCCYCKHNGEKGKKLESLSIDFVNPDFQQSEKFSNSQSFSLAYKDGSMPGSSSAHCGLEPMQQNVSMAKV